MSSTRDFYKSIKFSRFYDADTISEWFTQVSNDRVEAIAKSMESYISTNLPEGIRQKSRLKDYRTSPYVLMATAGALRLDDLRRLAEFLIDIKLYMGLETSFGKSIESEVMPHYPSTEDTEHNWGSPIEKAEEFKEYDGLTAEEKSARRVDSVWREIDSACVHGDRRHFMTIKSGVATINDTQVSSMFSAIAEHHDTWLKSSQERFGVSGIDIVIGLTYGTDRSTNNKENQILVKLITAGFEELDRENQPGVLQNSDGTVRVYRKIGIDYWAYTASPSAPDRARHTFLEVLLGLALALRRAHERRDIAAALNERLDLLSDAFETLRFPEDRSIPSWVSESLTTTERTWLAAAMSGFFDEERS